MYSLFKSVYIARTIVNSQGTDNRDLLVDVENKVNTVSGPDYVRKSTVPDSGQESLNGSQH